MHLRNSKTPRQLSHVILPQAVGPVAVTSLLLGSGLPGISGFTQPSQVTNAQGAPVLRHYATQLCKSALFSGYSDAGASLLCLSDFVHM